MSLEPILDVWGVHSAVITLEYHRNRSIIDLYPFFNDLFAQRDEYYSSSKLDFPRKGGSKNVPEFYFTLEHFFETFLGSYTPRNIADFLQSHFDLEQPQAAAFLIKIRTAKRTHQFLRYRCCNSVRYWGHRKTPWYFEPQGFAFERLGVEIPKSLQPRDQPKQYGTKSSSPLVRGKISPVYFREQLLQTIPPTVILHDVFSAPKLDYFFSAQSTAGLKLSPA